MKTISAILPPARQRVIDETIALLAGLCVGPDDGASKEGDSVTVRATTAECDEGQSLLITCYVHGHRTADWNRLRVALATEAEPEQLYLVPLLNERGQVRVTGLAGADFRLRAFHRLPFIFRHPLASQRATLRQQQVVQLARGVDGRLIQQVGVRTEPLPTTMTRDAEIVLDEPMKIELGDDLALTLLPESNAIGLQPQQIESINRFILHRSIENLTDAPARLQQLSTAMRSDRSLHTSLASDTNADSLNGPVEVLWIPF